MSKLVLDIKRARRKIKLIFNPFDKEILVDLKLRMKEETWKNKTRWFEKTKKNLIDTKKTWYFRAVKQFNENSSSESVPKLIHDGGKVSSGADRAKNFRKVFFKTDTSGTNVLTNLFSKVMCQWLICFEMNIKTNVNNLRSMTFAMISTEEKLMKN